MKKYGELLEKLNAYVVLAASTITYGPYTRSDGRQIVVVKDEHGKTKTVSYPKYLLEQHLGRPLDPNTETVDHIDSNFLNNDIDNLRIMPRDQHSADDTRRVKPIKLKCDMCGSEFERSPRHMRDRHNKGSTGNFCSRQCSGKYNRLVQLKKIEKLPVQEYMPSEYYKRKHIAEFIENIVRKYGSDDAVTITYI